MKIILRLIVFYIILSLSIPCYAGDYATRYATGTALAVVTPASGGSGIIGGADTQVQFNDGGVFGGDAGFTFIKASDSVDIAGHLALGADASISAITILDIDETLTTIDTTIYGIFAQLDLVPSGVLGAATHMLAMDIQAHWNGATDGSVHGSIQGVKGEGVNISATHNIAELVGVYGKASNLAPTDATDVIAGLFNATNDDALGTEDGDVTNAYSLLSRAYTDKDTGRITNRYGLYVEDTTGAAGLLTNQYGIYIEDINYADTLNYAIYSLGGNVELTDGNLTTTGNIQGAFELSNGTTLRPIALSIASDGTDITASLSSAVGTDIIFNFSDGLTTVDVTAPMTTVLTEGTDTVPKMNYLYVLKTDPTTLVDSIVGFPAAEYCAIGRVVCQSATTLQGDGPLKQHTWWDEVVDSHSYGHMPHVSGWIRDQWGTWKTGVVPTFSGTGTGTIGYSSTAGTVRQLHLLDFPLFADGADVYCVNDPDTAYRKITNIADLQKDSDGDTLTNRTYGLVFWGAVSDDDQSKIFVNLPSGSELNATNARTDSDKFIDYSISTDFRGVGFLIYRLIIKNTANTSWTLYTGGIGDDLRGQFPNTSAGTTSVTGTAFADNVFEVYDNGDLTKKVEFELSGATPDKTFTFDGNFTDNRTVILPDADGTFVVDNNPCTDLEGTLLSIAGGVLNATEAQDLAAVCAIGEITTTDLSIDSDTSGLILGDGQDILLYSDILGELSLYKAADTDIKIVFEAGSESYIQHQEDELQFYISRGLEVVTHINAGSDIYTVTDFVSGEGNIEDIYERGVVIENLAAADDNMSLGFFAKAVTITGVACSYVGTGTTPATITLEDGGGNAMTITDTNPTCVAHGTDATYKAVTAGNTLNSGEIVRFDVTNTPDPTTDDYTIMIKYTIQ